MSPPTATGQPRAAGRDVARSGAPPDGNPTAGWSARWRRWWPMATVLVAFGISALIVPTLAPVAIGDDWVYAREAHTLFALGRLRILEPAAAVSVFEAVWGAAWAKVFGFSFGVLRVSSVVLSAFGAMAVYGLGRVLRLPAVPAAVGAALFLFNPLSFVLSFTYMTDPHFTALVALAGLGYVSAITADGLDRRRLIVAGIPTSLAILSRQQGVVLVPTVLLVYLLARRIRLDRRGMLDGIATVVLPALTVVAYGVWVVVFRGVPTAQSEFAGRVVEAGVRGVGQLAARHSVIQPMYVGTFVAPVALVAAPFVVRAVRRLPRAAQIGVAALAVAFAAGAARFFVTGRRMPLLPSYWNFVGLGPYDVLGTPAGIIRPWMSKGLTLGAGVAFVVVAVLVVAARMRPDSAEEAHRVSLLLAIMVVLGLSALPASVTFRNAVFNGVNVPGLDRYLLPLLPFAAVLTVWAAHRAGAPVALGGVLLVAVAIYSVAGTRDHLVFQRDVWRVAREANRMGIPDVRIDAGAAWDGDRLWQYSVDHHSPVRTPNGPWWTTIFAPATNSDYVIGGAALPGFEVVRSTHEARWLEKSGIQVFMNRRLGSTGPP